MDINARIVHGQVTLANDGPNKISVLYYSILLNQSNLGPPEPSEFWADAAGFSVDFGVAAVEGVGCSVCFRMFVTDREGFVPAAFHSAFGHHGILSLGWSRGGRWRKTFLGYNGNFHWCSVCTMRYHVDGPAKSCITKRMIETCWNPKKIMGCLPPFTTYELVIWILLAHPQYLMVSSWEKHIFWMTWSWINLLVHNHPSNPQQFPSSNPT